MDPECIGLRIDDILIDLPNRQLWRGNQLIPLNSKYFDALLLLASHPKQLITRQQLFEHIWKDVIVTDWALSQCIKDIRKALGDEATHPRYIKTFPKHGFMFMQEPVQLKPGDARPGAFLSRRPYKFLDYYREDDREYFFGREAEISLICSKVLSHRCFVLYGRSGVGKSSIVHAGLLPDLRERGLNVCAIRHYRNPLSELQETLRGKAGAVSEAITQINHGKEARGNPDGWVCLFDQFEEFFSQTDPEARAQFLTGLENFGQLFPIPLHLVFIIREDFLAEMNLLKSIFPEIFHHEYRLQRLEPEQALRAVLKPAKKDGFDYESRLVDRIIADLSEQGFVDPPQLQIVCDTLYDLRDSSARISFRSYQELGGAAGILSQYLKRVINRFPAEEIDLAKFLLMSLVSNDARRLLLPVSDLESQLAGRFGWSSARIRDTMEDLSRARLLRFRVQNSQSLLELTHDFLIPEISSWLTEEDIVLRRAEGLLVRGLENFKVHQLLLDPDTIAVILPVGEHLNLTTEQCELLLKSLLSRGKSLPSWLIARVPDATSIVQEAARNEQPEIRLAAVQSAGPIADAGLKDVLRNMALWDADWQVRRQASIMLTEKYGQDGLKWLSSVEQNPPPGLIRRAVSIALVRDQHPERIRLKNIPPVILALVAGGLAWIRLHRHQAQIRQQTAGGTSGAALSGLSAGAILGALLVYYRQTPLYESITLLLALSSMGTITGMLAGLGISLGMSSIQAIGYRHSRYWSIPGATLGGMLIGGVMHLIGVDTFFALFGQKLQGVAGAYEGGLIGLGLSAGRQISQRWQNRYRWVTHLFSALGAMLAAILLTLIQGNLFSASIEALAHSFTQSQIKLETLSVLFGEAHFGQISRLILGAVEGFLFGGFLSLGYDRMNRSIGKN